MIVREAHVHRLAASAPDDVSALSHAIETGQIDPTCLIGILGKTEGNGCVNDFSRGLAVRALTQELERHIGAVAARKVCLVMSGGTEGALSPHFTTFEARPSSERPQPGSLALGRSHTRMLAAEEIGRLAQVDIVAEGVIHAMADAGISDPADVHFVQIKCPLLTDDRIHAAKTAGASLVTHDALKSMGLSRAASALGCAIALGEISQRDLSDAAIGQDWSLYSTRASASAGSELLGHEIVVMGAGQDWAGPLRIGSAVMADAIDIEPVRSVFARLGLATSGQIGPEQRAHLKALLAKAEASSTGEVRGRRHTMSNDSDIAATRHARGFVAGALAALVGDTQIYVSGGAEHQGPNGGGPVCVIVSARSSGQTQ